MKIIKIDHFDVGDAVVIARTLSACVRQVLTEIQKDLAVEVIVEIGVHGTIADFVESAIRIPDLSQFALAIGMGFLGELKYEVMHAQLYGGTANLEPIKTRICV